MTVQSYLRAMVRAHRELIPEPEYSRKGAISDKDLKLYPLQILVGHASLPRPGCAARRSFVLQ